MDCIELFLTTEGIEDSEAKLVLIRPKLCELLSAHAAVVYFEYQDRVRKGRITFVEDGFRSERDEPAANFVICYDVSETGEPL